MEVPAPPTMGSPMPHPEVAPPQPTVSDQLRQGKEQFEEMIKKLTRRYRWFVSGLIASLLLAVAGATMFNVWLGAGLFFVFVAQFFNVNAKEIEAGRYEVKVALAKLKMFDDPANASKMAELQSKLGQAGGGIAGGVPSAPKANIETPGQYL